MGIRRIGTDDHHHIGGIHRIEVLSAGRFTEGRLQAVARGRMANAGAGIDVVVAEGRSDEFLDQIRLLIGAARRGDATDRAAAVFFLDAPEFAGGIGERFLPRHHTPRVSDFGPNHRVLEAIRMGGVTPGKTAFDAGVPVVGLPILVRNHAHHLAALHFRAE